MLLGNNGGLTHFILWSTLVLPGFITTDNPSQEVTHCYFLCSTGKLTLLQSIICFLRISWQLPTEILSHHKHLSNLIMIRVQSTLQLSCSATVPQHSSPASVWVIFKQCMTIHEYMMQVKSLWIMTHNIQSICRISTVNFPNHCQNLLACCFMPSFFNF